MAKQRAGYYSPSDLMEILNISRTKALEIFHMFEQHGKLERFGPKTLRVEIREFEKWLKMNRGNYGSTKRN